MAKSLKKRFKKADRISTASIKALVGGLLVTLDLIPFYYCHKVELIFPCNPPSFPIQAHTYVFKHNFV